MKGSSRSAAYGALAAALGVVLVYIASVVPTGKIVVLCVASLGTVFVLTRFGWKWALGSFAVTAALSLILCPTKSAAILYAAFLGYYPVAKVLIERLRRPAFRWGGKLICFNAAAMVLFFAARTLFRGDWGPLGGYPLILLVLANALFVLYDLALQQGMLYFMRNIARRIK